MEEGTGEHRSPVTPEAHMIGDTPDDLQELGEISPDTLLIVTRTSEYTPIAGQPATPLQETGRLVRYQRIVMLNVPAVGSLDGELLFVVAADSVTAEIAYGNEADRLRRDGWTVRTPDPWETPDPLVTERIPF